MNRKEVFDWLDLFSEDCPRMYYALMIDSLTMDSNYAAEHCPESALQELRIWIKDVEKLKEEK